MDDRGARAGQQRDRQRQKAAVERCCIASGTTVDAWLSDLGSGLTCKRQHLIDRMLQVERGAITAILMAPQGRFGDAWLEACCGAHGTLLTVLKADSLSPEPDMRQARLAMMRGLSSRLDGLRKYKQTLQAMVTDAGHA